MHKNTPQQFQRGASVPSCPCLRAPCCTHKPWRSEVDECDVDALAALQFNVPRAGERAVTTRLGDIARQVPERLRHRHVSHSEAIWVAYCHHCNVPSRWIVTVTCLLVTGKVRQTWICTTMVGPHVCMYVLPSWWTNVFITPLRRSGMTRVLKGSYSFTCTPRVHPLTEWTIPAFSFPAEAGPYLPIPKGRKAELAWVAGYMSGTENWTRKRSPTHVLTGPDVG